MAPLMFLLFLALLPEVTVSQPQQQQVTMAEQCLIQTVGRINQNTGAGINQGDANTVRIFQALCGSYNQYIACLGNGLNTSRLQADYFVSLLYNRNSLRGTYRGLCGDLREIEPRVQCLRITPPVQQCYDDFNQAVNQLAQSRNRGPLNILQTLACNVSVSRYRCEIGVYRTCDHRLGQIMSDFLYGGLPLQCQSQTGVSSLYTLLYGGGSVTTVQTTLLVVTVLLAAWTFYSQV